MNKPMKPHIVKIAGWWYWLDCKAAQEGSPLLPGYYLNRCRRAMNFCDRLNGEP